MLVKQDSCRLNNTDSLLYTVFRNFDIIECIIFIGKGILPKKHANICFFISVFALNIHRVHIQVFVNVLLHSCFEKALFR